jgi:hypothetical protein
MQNYFLFICIYSGIKHADTLIGHVLMKVLNIPRGYIILIIRTYLNTADVTLMETRPIIECIKVYTNEKYSLIMLIDGNKVISILSLFLTKLDTVYPEQLLFVYQLDSQKNLLKSLLLNCITPWTHTL